MYCVRQVEGQSNYAPSGRNNGGSEILKRGDARQCISLVVIYDKGKQLTICLLYGQRQLIEKILSQ